MHRPSRTRRILKWAWTGVSVLILAAWVVSIFKAFGYVDDGWAFVFCGGCGFPLSGPRIYASESSDLFDLMDAQLRGSTGFTWPRVIPIFNERFVVIPLWLPFIFALILTAWLWHRDRRSQRLRLGQCPRCGYNLTGNTSGVCSECGEKTATTQRPSALTQ